jgi:hypothetical protein
MTKKASKAAAPAVKAGEAAPDQTQATMPVVKTDPTIAGAVSGIDVSVVHGPTEQERLAETADLVKALADDGQDEAGQGDHSTMAFINADQDSATLVISVTRLERAQELPELVDHADLGSVLQPANSAGGIFLPVDEIHEASYAPGSIECFRALDGRTMRIVHTSSGLAAVEEPKKGS